MNDRDERALDLLVREALRRTPDEPVPTEFADQVMGARAPRRPRTRLWLGAIAVSAAAAIVIAVANRPPADADLVATARESVALGRAVAVMEAGSALERRAGRWSQRAGNVFYRVDHGGAFTLATPAGEVVVLGTCFRVEVDPMKLVGQTKVGFVAGAALATAVVVTVYEGRVRLANGQGQRELEAGEQGSFAPGEAPRALVANEAAARPASAVRPPVLVAATAPGEVDELRTKVAAQEKQLAELQQDLQRKGGGKGWVDVSHDELVARASRCELRWEQPEINGYEVHPLDEKSGWARAAGLSDTERDAYTEALREVHTSVTTQLRQLLVEATGDVQMADKLPASGLINLLMEKTPGPARVEARTRLSKERAGLVPPPADLAKTPVIERALRVMTGAGDELERRFGERVGAERAHSLRLVRDGWPGGRSSMNGCAN